MFVALRLLRKELRTENSSQAKAELVFKYAKLARKKEQINTCGILSQMPSPLNSMLCLNLLLPYRVTGGQYIVYGRKYLPLEGQRGRQLSESKNREASMSLGDRRYFLRESAFTSNSLTSSCPCTPQSIRASKRESKIDTQNN